MTTMTASSETLYQAVAERIKESIERGVLRSGDRVPSVRKLSARENVSISTVLQAYMILESQGWIEARPQSGYYVRQRIRQEMLAVPEISRPPQNPTRVGVCEYVRQVWNAALDRNVVPLGAACPSPELLPYRKLNRLMNWCARQNGHLAHAYDFPPGCEALRRQIARRSVDWGCSLSADEIITTCGATEALSIALRAVTRPGDTVAIESPTFFGILQVIELLGLKALEVPTCPVEGVWLERFEPLLKRKKIAACLFVPNFQNPTGGRMPDQTKKRLVELLDRHEIPLIEDDLYGDLHFSAERPIVCKSFDRTGNVMLCSSFSKTLSGGYRVGWIAPGRYYDRVLRHKTTTSLATATLPQMTLASFLRDGGYDHHLRKLRRCLKEQTERCADAVGRYFPAGTRITRPTGGYVLWVELPGKIDTLDLHRRALAEGISIVPGRLFSATNKYSNFIRLSCGYPWSAHFESAFQRLGRMIQS